MEAGETGSADAAKISLGRACLACDAADMEEAKRTRTAYTR